MKLTTFLLAGTFVAGVALFGASTAQASTYNFPVTPNTGNDATYGGANLVVQFNADGSIVTFAPTGATANYDGSEDALIGVINLTSHVITSFNISGSFIFGFDGDGIDTYNGNTSTFTINPSNPDTTTYGGPDGYFTGINGALSSGTVNFVGGIAAGGGSDFFSLEEPISLSAPPIITTNTPEPASLALIAIGLLGFGAARRRRRS
jgi:hypothetical protein